MTTITTPASAATTSAPTPTATPAAPQVAAGAAQTPIYGFGSAVNVQWAQRYACGCWTLMLGQGIAALPCAAHQSAVVKAIQSSAT